MILLCEWVNVSMIDIVTEYMMSMSICESNMSWYAYVLRKMLRKPNPCRIGISKELCILFVTMHHVVRMCFKVNDVYKPNKGGHEW